MEWMVETFKNMNKQYVEVMIQTNPLTTSDSSSISSEMSSIDGNISEVMKVRPYITNHL